MFTFEMHFWASRKFQKAFWLSQPTVILASEGADGAALAGYSRDVCSRPTFTHLGQGRAALGDFVEYSPLALLED